MRSKRSWIVSVLIAGLALLCFGGCSRKPESPQKQKIAEGWPPASVTEIRALPEKMPTFADMTATEQAKILALTYAVKYGSEINKTKEDKKLNTFLMVCVDDFEAVWDYSSISRINPQTGVQEVLPSKQPEIGVARDTAAADAEKDKTRASATEVDHVYKRALIYGLSKAPGADADSVQALLVRASKTTADDLTLRKMTRAFD